MRDMIQVNYENQDRPTVSGRELHEALQIRTPYKDWFPRMCEYGFVEGADFNPLNSAQVRAEGGRTVTRTILDHQLTISMAKELCMIQRTDKGRAIRRYFIQVEEMWNSPQQVMARALQMASRQLAQLKEDNAALTAQAQADRPKVLFADSVAASQSCILVGELAKLLKQNGVDMGQNRLFSWMREHGYLIRRQGGDYNMPTQRAMELGLFQIKETSVTHADGHVSVNKTPKVTGKGQLYFVGCFLSKGQTFPHEEKNWSHKEEPPW